MSKNNLPGGNGNDGNMTEDALRDAGKSEHEARSTGAIDRADEGVEEMFGEKARTTNSPIHKVVWDNVDVSAFLSEEGPANPLADEAIDKCIELVREQIAAGTLYDANGKIREEFLANELGNAGYWGLRIAPKFGGKGASDRAFMKMITRLAQHEATLAGMSSIHGCIGAVDPTMTFGTEEQQARILPQLASGKRLSAFALTEPGAGSDMTALKTTAVDKGDYYEINGEKLFISNAIPGRTVGLVAMLNGQPAVFIADLPEKEDETFQVKHYKIVALRRTYNNGLVFKNFKVPKENHLKAPRDNGLIIAYHGLNYGRVALCANAAGVMRVFLRSITPGSWGSFRKTYGQSIEKRDLVQRRIARLAALIVGADALTAWCSTILDNGYRGELECIIAKIFGSEAQKEAAIELVMKTHGGRSFLEGHLFADNLADFLAPCIYEGEGEMLGMAFFKGLGKKHITDYMVPLGNGQKLLSHARLNVADGFDPKDKQFKTPKGAVIPMESISIKHKKTKAKIDPATYNPDTESFKDKSGADVSVKDVVAVQLGTRNILAGLWGMGWGVARYGMWYTPRKAPQLIGKALSWALAPVALAAAPLAWVGRKVGLIKNDVNTRLKRHSAFGKSMARQCALDLTEALQRHQLKLADRQCIISLLSQRVQDSVVILITAGYGLKSKDPATKLAADVLCQDLQRKLTGEAVPSDAYFTACNKLAEMVIDGKFSEISGVPTSKVLQAYEQK